jgi:hypothetical protein
MRTPIGAPQTGVNTNTATSLAGVANAGNTFVGAAPNQSSAAYGNPGAASGAPQLLSNLAGVTRGVGPAIINHWNVQPVFDVYANLDRRDLGAVGGEVEKIVKTMESKLPRGTTLAVRGQISTMENSFYRLGLGMVFAVILVYLLMAVNFQSWMDPFIILRALPGAMAGIVWILFLTQTTFSVPSLMGAIMCVGVATANSILLVVFANDQREEGMDARSAALSAGHTRIRPVIMTAGAMIIGMLPMAIGLGEGGEQNAPLGRAVIGGLTLATVTTLFIVPLVYSMLRTKAPVDFERKIIEEEHEYLRTRCCPARIGDEADERERRAAAAGDRRAEAAVGGTAQGRAQRTHRADAADGPAAGRGAGRGGLLSGLPAADAAGAGAGGGVPRRRGVAAGSERGACDAVCVAEQPRAAGEHSGGD